MSEDHLLYSFFNADQIWDFLLSIGMKPFVELSFMPTTLASGDTVVFHYRANVTPPKDYRQWAALIHKLVAHWVERYGIDEVRTWFFEVWNEPNLKAFWPGHAEEYFKLYRHYRGGDQGGGRSTCEVGGPGHGQGRMDSGIPRFLREKSPAGRLRQHAPLPDRCTGVGRRGYRDATRPQSAQHPARVGPGLAPPSAWAAALLHGMELPHRTRATRCTTSRIRPRSSSRP